AIPSVEEELHFERPHVAVHELEQRARQARNGLRGEVVVLVDGVLFGVEEHTKSLARMLDRDLCFRQAHALSSPPADQNAPRPMRSRWAMRRWSIWRTTA